MTIRPVPGLTLEQQPDEVLLRCCLWAEARGEPNEGVLAVAHVILTRAKKSGKSVGGVILAPYQFSWTMESDPNRGKVLDAWEKDAAGWQRVDIIGWLASHGYTVDPTLGATHYYAYKSCSPKWGRGNPDWVETAQIGNHVFGRAK